MKEEDILNTEHLHAQNTIYIAIDYLNNLSLDIEKTNPNDKWKEIVKNLNTINNDLSNFKLFLVRLFQEFELNDQINLMVKKKGMSEVLTKIENYDKLERELNNIKKNIK